MDAAPLTPTPGGGHICRKRASIGCVGSCKELWGGEHWDIGRGDRDEWAPGSWGLEVLMPLDDK